jgi:hypothetical protein
LVTICTTSLTFNKSTFCPHSIFMCFVRIWEQTAIISLYNINWLVFITYMECVYCSILPKYIYIYICGKSRSLTINGRTWCCAKNVHPFHPQLETKYHSKHLKWTVLWHLKRHTPKVIRSRWTLIQRNRSKSGRFLDPACLSFERLWPKKNFVNVRNTKLPLHLNFTSCLKFFTSATGHKGTLLRDSWCSTGWERQTINAGIGHNHMFIIETHKTFCWNSSLRFKCTNIFWKTMLLIWFVCDRASSL